MKRTKERKPKGNLKNSGAKKYISFFCEMKNSPKEFICRFELVEERVGELEDREMEISKSDG